MTSPAGGRLEQRGPAQPRAISGSRTGRQEGREPRARAGEHRPAGAPSGGWRPDAPLGQRQAARVEVYSRSAVEGSPRSAVGARVAAIRPPLGWRPSGPPSGGAQVEASAVTGRPVSSRGAGRFSGRARRMGDARVLAVQTSVTRPGATRGARAAGSGRAGAVVQVCLEPQQYAGPPAAAPGRAPEPAPDLAASTPSPGEELRPTASRPSATARHGPSCARGPGARRWPPRPGQQVDDDVPLVTCTSWEQGTGAGRPAAR